LNGVLEEDGSYDSSSSIVRPANAPACSAFMQLLCRRDASGVRPKLPFDTATK
jgi:hypothetical protein